VCVILSASTNKYLQIYLQDWDTTPSLSRCKPPQNVAMCLFGVYLPSQDLKYRTDCFYRNRSA
jgi:hypothetical protein